MSQRMRVTLVRAAFVLLCVAPTVLLLGWIAHGATDSVTPLDKPLWEEELSWILGLDVRVERVEQPQRGRTVLYGVVLEDPEGGELARVRAVELARTEDGLVIAAEQPELSAGRLARLWEVVRDRVLRMRKAGDLPVHFTAGELTVRLPEKSPGETPHAALDEQQRAVTLSSVEARIVETETGPQLSATFYRVDLAGGEPVEVHVLRQNRLAGPPSTRWSLDTKGTPLPCWLAAEQLPPLARLGEGCEFQGRCWGERTVSNCRGELSGTFLGVDLYQLVTLQFPHLLTGVATVEVESAELRGGRIEVLRGKLAARQGTIGRGLVQAAVTHLPLKLSEAARPPDDENWRYEDLAFEFDLHAAGLHLTGLCDNIGDVVLTDARGPLLVRRPLDELPGGMHVPALNLARLLAGDPAPQAPATREIGPLVGLLPIPSSLQSTPAADASPSATLRYQGTTRRP